MGAQTFIVYRTKGDLTAKQAFNDAREEAFYNYGHRGYTGTIAEKNSFKMLPVLEGKTAAQSAEEYVYNDHPAVSDKWGPAGCIDSTEDNKYYFFGWASA